MITSLWLSGSFLYSSPVYSCHLLISSASVRSLPFVLYHAHPYMKYPLDAANFLDEISGFPFYCFPLPLHCSLKKAFLFLLAALWNSAFNWVYLSHFPLFFSSLLYSAICKASSDNHSAFLHFVFLGMPLFTASCTML